MDLDNGTGTQARFAEYTARLASVLGHADRVTPFADYCIGLLSAEGRKSVEPLAAVTAPERTVAQHQSLLHFVAQAPWSDQAMLRRMREAVLPSDLIGRGLGRSHPSLLTVRAGARARDASPRPV